MPHCQPDARPNPDIAQPRRARRRARTLGVSAAGLAAAALILAPAAGAFNFDDTLGSYKTLPGSFPEQVKLVTKKSTAFKGNIFLGSKRNVPGWQMGATILDDNAKVVWYKPLTGTDYIGDVRPQTYLGKPVVGWWQGTNFRGYGEGQGEIYDTHYHHVATVKAGNGRAMDIHEFNITPQGTALIIAYQKGTGDLTNAPGGGPANGLIQNNYVQEVDIKTGKVLMEWNGAKDVPYSESFNTVPKDTTIPYDWMHLNSVNLTTDGQIVVSSRATHTYYKINRKTGKLIWKLGGKNTDFKMGKNAQTLFQHDVHQLSASFWSAFDNAADAVPVAGAAPKHSRGVILKVDQKKMTVTLKKEFVHPKKLLGVSQGNMQTLPGAHEFVGWGGDRQYMTEFDAKGRVVWDARLLSTATDTYRAYKSKWVGSPTDQPLVDAQSAAGTVTISVSWNGATEVAEWRVLGGSSADNLDPVGTLTWKDLETSGAFGTTATKFKVEALDAKGKVLGTSDVVDAHA